MDDGRIFSEWVSDGEKSESLSPYLTVNVPFTLSSVVQSVTLDSTCRSSKNRVTLNRMLKLMTATTAILLRTEEGSNHVV